MLIYLCLLIFGFVLFLFMHVSFMFVFYECFVSTKMNYISRYVRTTAVSFTLCVMKKQVQCPSRGSTFFAVCVLPLSFQPWFRLFPWFSRHRNDVKVNPEDDMRVFLASVSRY